MWQESYYIQSIVVKQHKTPKTNPKATKSAKKGKDKTQKPHHLWRFIITFTLIVIVIGILVYRLSFLETKDRVFLKNYGQSESTRDITLDATRGIIYDRNNVPLAVSTNLYKVILDIKVLKENRSKYLNINKAQIDGLSLSDIMHLIHIYPNKRYYIAAQFVEPSKIDILRSLHIPGVQIKEQNRTYYPKANAVAPLIGFTNIKNQGQAGLLYSYNKTLGAQNGILSAEVDREGQAILFTHAPKHYHLGKDVHLTIDSNIQGFTYNALKKGVINAEADSGAAVVIDPQNGEVLALASYPSFNPNRFSEHASKHIASQGLIETIEPGSTIKPFFIAEALLSGKYTPDTIINTNPGYYFLQHHRIRDDSNFGKVTLTEILEKSSNVGVSKVALSLNKQKVYDLLSAVGFGQSSPISFPRATNGYLPEVSSLSTFEFATSSFGYALTSSIAELAHAYTIFANNGKLCPMHLVLPKSPPECPQIIPQKVASEVLNMLHTVVTVHGTGVLANIPGFEVAGKTGTSHRVKDGHFTNTYNAVFAGIAPLKDPRLVIAVWINDPKKNHFYQFGGVSAAPIFASIAKKTLQYLGVPYQEPLDHYRLLNRDKKWLLQVIENN
ncbi:peptidoglycan D,D-transpeptidase FtsI family protein [Fangia hongkongensis]|uniref:peptidoglycan D,D-transpeptidase FtsI family protein n=1 Tax=Fangia hongkongensis TaxID=270495 RepID=UPI0003704423|nr:penicillin-binding protein 2 [Fangia hongkongensis]